MDASLHFTTSVLMFLRVTVREQSADQQHDNFINFYIKMEIKYTMWT